MKLLNPEWKPHRDPGINKTDPEWTALKDTFRTFLRSKDADPAVSLTDIRQDLLGDESGLSDADKRRNDRIWNQILTELQIEYKDVSPMALMEFPE